MSEETLFDLARKTPEAERAALLERVCEGKPELRSRVEALLNADAAASPLSKQSPTLDLTAGFNHTAQASPDLVGTIIDGRFKLQQKLGEGGMGTVWVAEQEKPVKRRVALKLIKAGMDSAQVIRRFEAERQALALMDHTNIAKVLDAGSTTNGRPYFVMELVKGVPITKYCDEVHASIKNRLELFVQVCSAVQHAHQKGIIHRDIKPSNVLIAMQDGKPVPKVIDFGVAKALHSKLADQTMYTEIGQIIGTLEYMAPEQAELSAMDIDTRADIYALGVLLYELLTGSTPITRERMKSAAFAEVIRLIKEEDPPKPSTRLTQSKESLANLAALRKTDPKHLSSELKGELDWVVLKALEKDRTCRYETANGLSRDIQRYLADEVVEARPPSAGYRLRKFVRRNKGKVLAAGLVFLTLIIGIIGTSWGFWQAEKQRALAVHAQNNERERAEGERSAKEQTERRLKQIEKSNEILGSVFESLEPKQIAESEKPLQAVLVDHLTKAADELDGEAIGDPVVTADMQIKIGNSLHALGAYSKAVSLLEKAYKTYETKLGNDDARTHSCMNDLAKAFVSMDKPLLALPLFEQILKQTKATLGPAHSDTITYQNNAATAYGVAGKHELAIQLFEEALKNAKSIRGYDDSLTLNIMNNLAGAYIKNEELNRGIILYEETLKLRKARLGLTHPDTLHSMNNLASVYWEKGQLDKSIPLMQEVLQSKINFLGREHPSTLLTIANLGVNLKDAGRYREGLPLLEETYRTRQKYPTFNGFCKPLFECYISMKLAEPAKALVNDVVTYARNQLPDQSTELSNAFSQIGLSLLQVNAWIQAEPILRECLLIRENKQPEAWTTFYTRSMLGGALLGQKKYADAEPLLLKGYEGMNAREKTIPPQGSTRLAEALDRLIQLYTETNKPDEVKKWQSVKDKLTKPVEKK